MPSTSGRPCGLAPGSRRNLREYMLGPAGQNHCLPGIEPGTDRPGGGEIEVLLPRLYRCGNLGSDGLGSHSLRVAGLWLEHRSETNSRIFFIAQPLQIWEADGPSWPSRLFGPSVFQSTFSHQKEDARHFSVTELSFPRDSREIQTMCSTKENRLCLV